MKKIRIGKKFILVVLGLVLIASGLVKYVWHYANSPAQGTVSIQESTNPVENIGNDEYVSVGNKYFSLLYPNHLTDDLPEKSPSGNLTYDYFSRRDDANNVTDSLEVYFKGLSKGGVTQDADYKNYVAQPKTYKISNKNFMGETVILAKKDSDGHERVALWAHGGNILIIKLKSSSKDDLDTYFDTILRSVQWQ